MKYYIISILTLLLLGACNQAPQRTTQDIKTPEIRDVAITKGEQLTGVTVSNKRVFVNFPRWRNPIRFSVAELDSDNNFGAYPNERWNSWTMSEPVHDSIFVAVQSVVASHDLLYVVDTRNPLFQGVMAAPVIFVFDLKTNKLVKSFKLPVTAFYQNSYINDIRIDEKRGYAYCTDSGHAGLVIINLKTGEVKRRLNDHFSTRSEQDYLTINGKKWQNTVHSDGIAFDAESGLLYYHALTGYNLYAIPVEVLINGADDAIEQAVKRVAKTAAPDGMIIHKGKLYYADLEGHRILQMDLKTKQVETVLAGEDVKWADTFSIEGETLYYTNSRIHEASGAISEMLFSVHAITLLHN